jgi:hypothetical protein
LHFLNNDPTDKPQLLMIMRYQFTTLALIPIILPHPTTPNKLLEPLLGHQPLNNLNPKTNNTFLQLNIRLANIPQQVSEHLHRFEL